jgi:hypothetical protein
MPRAENVYDPEDNIEQDPCILCEISRQAIAKIPDEDCLRCPSCHARIDPAALGGALFALGNGDIIVVGETNTISLDEHYHKAIRFDCLNCGKITAIRLDLVSWNANHDVYYTGGRSYVYNRNNIKTAIKEKLLPKIENYHDRIHSRIKNPTDSFDRNLTPSSLLCWIEYEVEHIVAAALFEAGLQSRDLPNEEPLLPVDDLLSSVRRYLMAEPAITKQEMADLLFCVATRQVMAIIKDSTLYYLLRSRFSDDSRLWKYVTIEHATP